MSLTGSPVSVVVPTTVTFDITHERCEWCPRITELPSREVLIEHARHRIAGIDYVPSKITLTTFRIGRDWLPEGWIMIDFALTCPDCAKLARGVLVR